jgi:hypothetical protein
MNKIVANASGIIGRVSENFKGITIKPVQSVLGSKPKKSFRILYAANGGIVGKSVLDLVMPEVIRLAG